MIPLPSKPKIVRDDGNRAVIEIEGLYPGYGHTIGNGLRRILLSSLPGSAITMVKIDGVGHEFSTIEGVMEDVTDLTLNLKQMRFRLHEEGPFSITLSVSGEREVTGRDFTMPSQVELVSPDLHIATITAKKTKLHIEAVVESGRGYVPVEARSKEKVEVGSIALDAAFSPVRHVNYEVENMRVGDRTDYNRLLLTIETDGSLEPKEAFMSAVAILTEQFSAIREGFDASVPLSPESSAARHAGGATDAPEDAATSILKTKIDDLKISSRTLNALREAGVKTVGGLARKRTAALGDMEGIGEKGIQEVKKALGNLGITLKP
ncbi:MAG: DNA-directed RNA polymerase subunit alpha [Patescibacteria group bacterium]